jgi:outer membrane protein with beta-barrel domain
MKKSALVFLAVISFAGAKAQFQFGVKAGANFATLSGSDVANTQTLVNFNGGVFAKLPFDRRWSLQPELVYSGQGTKADLNSITVSEHVNFLNIPILLKYSHGSGFYLETGPQAGFLLAAHETLQQTTTDVKSFYKSSDWSWVFGVGYKIPITHLGIDLRYNAGLTNIEDSQHTGSNGTIRNNVWQLGLTYVLFSSWR